MRRAPAAVAGLAALCLAGTAGPAGADAPPAAGGVHVISALENAKAAVVLVLDAPRPLDGEAYLAEGTVERAFSGGQPGERMTIAWEERARQRSVRFAAGDRVLIALEPLPGHSLWRQRLPDAQQRAHTLYVAERGEAFLRSPSLGGLLLLQHYLALPPDLRGRATGVGYLVDLAAEAEPPLAQAAVERLAAVEHLDAQIDAGAAARLIAALLRPDAPAALQSALLDLMASGPLRSMRAPLSALAEREPLGPALLYEALGRVDGGLRAELSLQLLAVRDSAPHRAAGARFATGAALERLPSVLRSDPSAEVRLAAARRWLEQKGVAGAAELRPALLDSDEQVRLQTVFALARQGPASVPVLRDVLPAASPELAREIVAALSLAGGPEAKKALAELAESHPDPGVRLLAQTALGRPLSPRD